MAKDVDFTRYQKGVTVEADAGSPTGYMATFIYEEQDIYEGISGDITDVQIYSDCMMLFNPDEGEVGKIDPAFAIDPWEYRMGLVNAGGQADVAYFAHMDKFADKLWGIQVPLLSGAMVYNFMVTDDSGNTVMRLYDPNNPTMFNEATGLHSLSSIAYVPYCAEKTGTGALADRTVENPCTIEEKKGRLEFLSYNSDIHGENRGLAVYLPYNYDPNREEPFNVLYISHGTSGDVYGNELRWLHEGAVVNIMDNLISEGKAEPFVIVCMNNQDLLSDDGVEWDYEAIEYEQFNYIMPITEQTYNVSREPAGRAYAGLSRGGVVAQRMLEDYGDEFSYFGIWSYAFDIDKDAILDISHPVNILLNAGKWDFGNSHIKAYREGLDSINIPYTYKEYPAAHDWENWKLIYAYAAEHFFWK